jgi:hypothetical protein
VCGTFVVTAAVWIGYNMLIFTAIASGWKMSYIPYLNYPMKIFVAALI